MDIFSDRECAEIFHDLRHRGQIAIAVSGGADSMALMSLAVTARSANPAFPGILILTVNHGLREAATAETQFVRRESASLGLPCKILTTDTVLSGGNIQAKARDLRYRLLCEACHEENIGTLLTAHHRDDQAETFLLRLARGSGVDGLSAIAPTTFVSGIEIVRPLLDITKSRLVAHLEASGQTWVEDPSNQDDRFARVKLRQMKSTMEAVGLTSQRLAKTARNMREAAAVLDHAADQLADDTVRLSGAGVCTITTDAYRDALPDTRYRLLARCLSAVGGSAHRPRFDRLRDLDAQLCDSLTLQRTLSGCKIDLADRKIRIVRETGRNPLPALQLSSGQEKLWDGRFRVSMALSNAAQTCTVRALGADGWREVISRAGKDVVPAYNRQGVRTAVSFWCDADLLAVPAISDFPSVPGFGAEFVGRVHSDPARMLGA